MWKRLWRVLGILAGAFLLTACGGQERQLGVDGYVYVPEAVRNYDRFDAIGHRAFCYAGGALYFGESSGIYRIPMEGGIDFGRSVEVPPLSKESAHALRGFLETIDFTPRSGLEDTIVSIVTEEAEAFFSGSKTAEETAKIIKNRVQILIQENR